MKKSKMTAEEVVVDAHNILSSESTTESAETETPSTTTEKSGEVIDAEFVITPDELSEAEHNHYQAIKEANREVKEKQYAYNIANSEAKAAKKELELASLELSNLIDEGPQLPEKPDPQKELPFGPDESESHPNWELTPITEALKLTAKQKDKLEEIGIKTVGQFEFLRAGRDPVYPDGLRSIKGFGAATVDAFENDIVNWLQDNAREPEKDGEGND